MGGALYDLFEFLAKYNVKRAQTREDVKEGDIVICLRGKKGSRPRNVISLGKVIHVGPTPLATGHEDGKVGHVFVLDYTKVRHKKDRPFNGEYFAFAAMLIFCLKYLHLILFEFCVCCNAYFV